MLLLRTHHKSRVVFFFSPFLVQVTVAPPDPPVPLFYNFLRRRIPSIPDTEGKGRRQAIKIGLARQRQRGRRRAQAGTGRAGRGYSFRHTYSSEPKQQLTPHRLQGTASRRRVSLPPPALR
jgi:hypothetical protein